MLGSWEPLFSVKVDNLLRSGRELSSEEPVGSRTGAGALLGHAVGAGSENDEDSEEPEE